MRVFIAINLPYHIKEKIAEATKAFKEYDLVAKWVETGNLHMTLKFLGEIEEKKTTEITQILKFVAGEFGCFEVTLQGFGFFPNEKRPRVFFVHSSKEELLKTIAARCEEKLEKIGFAKENRFKSHVTLARFKNNKNIECLKKEMENTRLKETALITGITLFKSTLTRSGPIYEEIFKAPLKSSE